MKRRNNKYNQLLFEEDDPISSLANLFDASMVFAFALMLAMVSNMGLNEFFSDEELTIVKNPGKENMEILIKEENEIKHYKSESKQSSGNGDKGKKVGTAYQLEDGRIIYVPDK